jgi:hypothetical protein
MLRPNADLATHPEMSIVVTTASQKPADTVLGPSFRGEDGDWYALIATSTGLTNSVDLMVATINLDNLFSGLFIDYTLLWCSANRGPCDD